MYHVLQTGEAYAVYHFYNLTDEDILMCISLDS